MTAAQRFWSRVDKTDSCWLWTGHTNRGYGRACFEGRTVYAHRLSWELTRGPIPDGLSLDHLCRVLNCVNPDHLEPVPHRTNVLRGEGPTAVNARKARCPKGHPYEGANLRRGRGGRYCRACAAAKDRRARLAAGRQREGRYACPLCGWRFDTPKGVATHKGRRHGCPGIPTSATQKGETA